VPSGTAVNGMTVNVEHTGASVSPASGEPVDFTGPQTFTVTAEDGTTQQYTVTVTAADTVTGVSVSPLSVYPPEGSYTSAQKITLTTTTPGTTIRYTLNGDEPTAATGDVYSSLTPINLSESKTLTAKAFKDGLLPSDTLTQVYTMNILSGVDYRDMVLATPDAINTVSIAGNAAYVDSAGNPGAFPPGRTVTLSPFKIAKYETTYDLWYTVRVWATSAERGAEQYTIANLGREGYSGSIDNTGGAPTANKLHSATSISWRSAIVWCNAYSEMTGKEPVYYTDTNYTTVLRVSTDTDGTATEADNAVMKSDANGYRLPTIAEWEYAGRGGGTPDPTGTFAYKWAGTNTAGTGAGQLGDYAWYSANPGGSVHTVGQKNGNSNLGLHDISGNVYEWGWDWSGTISNNETVTDPTGPSAGSGRYLQGGAFTYDAAHSALTARLKDMNPNHAAYDVGLRVVCFP